jgi:hypothetical protein
VRKLTLIAAAVLLAACSKDIQNQEAVKQGVVDYLEARTAQTGLNISSLQVDVTTVAFQKDEARATVAIRPKGGDGGGPMMMNYVLDRKGGKWVVRGRTENGVNPHGGAAPGDGSTLPPGHPSTDGGDGSMPPAGALPPGHPPVGSQK